MNPQVQEARDFISKIRKLILAGGSSRRECQENEFDKSLEHNYNLLMEINRLENEIFGLRLSAISKPKDQGDIDETSVFDKNTKDNLEMFMELAHGFSECALWSTNSCFICDRARKRLRKE